MSTVPEVFPQQQIGGTPGGFAAGASGDGEPRELGRLLREAAQLLENTDLSGANETLKKAEEALVLREGTDV